MRKANSDNETLGRKDHSVDSQLNLPNSESLIAIVGMACRFPGAKDLFSFWHQLEAGESAIMEGVPGSGVGRVGQLFSMDKELYPSACSFGAYLEDLDQFDASFFRISPVEAQFLDPQQRLMLETSWKALENAGISPEQLKGSRTGVYGGISNNEYRRFVLEAGDISEPASNLYAVTGTSFNTTIGRVAFCLGLEGPAISVDTACSSSLVAIHQALVGLQRRETDLALAGGVHLIFSGELLEMRAKAGMLAPDGKCKTFDASANGYVRGEGCGVVVLKRLEEAQADGDFIWGVIRGSAINQDGASQGLTVPNGKSQEKVIEEALFRAGALPSQVGYVEAHGTGTEVGDPIELQSMAVAYSAGRESQHPLLIGSVKTNIGHLEAAAGVASLIKVALSMRKGVIPKHLNFQNPNPKMDWDRWAMKVSTQTTPWPLLLSNDEGVGAPALAGVSGFGWSGTNAHIILEPYSGVQERTSLAFSTHQKSTTFDGWSEWGAGPLHYIPPSWPLSLSSDRSLPSTPVAISVDTQLAIEPKTELTKTELTKTELRKTELRKDRVLPLSAQSQKALEDLASEYLGWLESSVESQVVQGKKGEAELCQHLANMAWTASVGRSHFNHRVGLVFQDMESLKKGLRGVVEGQRGCSMNRVKGKAIQIAFLYTGQGSQWVGMGRTLYHREPVFREVLDRCEALFKKEKGASLLDVMFGKPEISMGSADPGNSVEESSLKDSSLKDFSLDNPAWKQPATYALECAFTALWASLGVQPDVVLGHSLGEIAAAQTAGVFSLEDGLRFAAARGACIGELPGDGAMAALFAPAPQVIKVVDRLNAAVASGQPFPFMEVSTLHMDDSNDYKKNMGVSIAADNGAHQVISGPTFLVESLVKKFESEGLRAKRLRKSPAYHSAMVEPALGKLEIALKALDFFPPSSNIALISGLTGQWVEPEQVLDANYWCRQAREPVAFQSCVETMAKRGVEVTVELGPHSVLGPMANLAWPEGLGETPRVVSSLMRPPTVGSMGSQNSVELVDHPNSETPGDSFLVAVSELYEAGVPLHFSGLFSGEKRRRIFLPSYPFQRESYWVKPSPKSKRRRGGASHNLLGRRYESAAQGEVVFETEVFPSDPGWLKDHHILGWQLVPGSLYGAMALATSLVERGKSRLNSLSSHDALIVKDMQLHNPLIFSDKLPEGDSGGKDRTQEEEVPYEGAKKVQLCLEPMGSGEQKPWRQFQILSRGEANGEWVLHAQGQIPSVGVSQRPENIPETAVDLEKLKSDFSPMDVSSFYSAKEAMGVQLGPAFQNIKKIWFRPGEALGEVTLNNSLRGAGWDLHPLLLDGFFQVLSAARGSLKSKSEASDTYLPFGWESFWWSPKGLKNSVICHVQIKDSSKDKNKGSEKDSDKDLEKDLENKDPKIESKADSLKNPSPGFFVGDFSLYNPEGFLVGELKGYVVKRATQKALLSSAGGIKDLLYKVAWRTKKLSQGTVSAHSLLPPADVAVDSKPLTTHLAEKGVEEPGFWILIADRGGFSEKLAIELVLRNQMVLFVEHKGRKKPDFSGDEASFPNQQPPPGWEAGQPPLDKKALNEEALNEKILIEKTLGKKASKWIRVSLDINCRDSWGSLLEDLPNRSLPFQGVVHLSALDGHGVESTVEEMGQDIKGVSLSALSLIQALEDVSESPDSGVWFITRGAQVLERECLGELAGATLWGMGKVIFREASHLRPQMIDLEETLERRDRSDEISSLVNELLYPDPETHVVYRSGNRHVGRLVRQGEVAREGGQSYLPEGLLRKDRAYLVTGGLGGIGCEVARWLADRGAQFIVLNGRRAPDSNAQELISSLEKRGVHMQIELADMTDSSAMDAMWERLQDGPPLAGVVHSVGALSDGTLGNQNWEKFKKVLEPKILGAWYLHRATIESDLDFFILFSSVAGVIGNPGQINYGAANAFLDQLAVHRRAMGLPGQAIAWGAWSGVGEAEEQRSRLEGLREALGTGWMTPQQGIKAFDYLVRQDMDSSVVASLNWSTFRNSVEDHSSLWEDLLPKPQEDQAPSLAENLLSHFQQAPEGEKENLLVSFLQQEIQVILRLSSPPLPKSDFFDLGMDSLMAVELRNRLNKIFDKAYSVPNTLVFEYPNTAGLARHLLENLNKWA